MKTGRIVLFLMVLSILWCADVFAHSFSADNPVAHFCPTTQDDPCMPSGCTDDPVKYEEFMDTYSGGHGHINVYQPGTDDASSWGYWTAGGMQLFVEMPLILVVARGISATIITTIITTTITTTTITITITTTITTITITITTIIITIIIITITTITITTMVETAGTVAEMVAEIHLRRQWLRNW